MPHSALPHGMSPHDTLPHGTSPHRATHLTQQPQPGWPPLSQSQAGLSWQQHRSPPGTQRLQEEGEGGRRGGGRAANTSQHRSRERFARWEPQGCPGTGLGSSRGSLSHPAAQGWELVTWGDCKRRGPQPSLSPCSGNAGVLLGGLTLVPMPARCQERHKPPCLCCQAELLLPLNLPRSPHRGRGRWKTTATAMSSPSPAAFEAALAIPEAEHHSRLALHQTTRPVPPGPGCHRAWPRLTVRTVPGEAGRGAAISSANHSGQ